MLLTSNTNQYPIAAVVCDTSDLLPDGEEGVSVKQPNDKLGQCCKFGLSASEHL
jgi:hypothetical protein